MKNDETTPSGHPDQDIYDPDKDALPSDDSPRLEAMTVTYKPAPSPKPEIDSDTSDDDEATAPRPPNVRQRAPATQGDAVLLTLLGNGNGPTREVASQAAMAPLPSDDDTEHHSNEGSRQTPVDVRMGGDTPQQQTTEIARAALAASDGMQPVVKTESGAEADSAHKNFQNIPSSKVSLPPILDSAPSPDKSPNNLTLPSISEQLGPIKSLGTDASAAPNDKGAAGAHRSPFPAQNSPPFYGYSPASRKTPPISPADSRRQLPSPENSTSHSYYTNASLRRYSLAAQENATSSYISPPSDHYSGNTTETPGTDQSTPASIPSVGFDRMSIDSMTNPPPGGFICTVENCTAAPFQTQYLLNSHANVHSSIRPHYCPVKNCPRSIGGKGFKRKNEMIRHGLVHESPGYVCPYCKDREHKYPRPDNLQRHVRVHHMDKDKDDPLLRDVLAQRPEGLSKGRRRRGGTN